ncbi:BON domain-containing protein [Salinisphaera sp. T31B1]|uniref:BON domain-containing protein n=1 Tax=Salinisphaera sp. T31B1 TaxID=727963 RepID=UPI003342247F
MNKLTVRFAATSLALVIGATTLAGCSKDPQEKYDDAVEQLNEAREARNDAQDKLNSKKEELAELQSNLDEAESNLSDARNQVDQASQAVNKTVNDEVLFRTIQRELLDKKKFDQAAISVGVQDRVVTLTGNVPDEKTHKQALETARSQAGVKNVVDQLQVKDTDAEKKQKDQQQKQQQQQNPPQPGDDGAGDKSDSPSQT